MTTDRPLRVVLADDSALLREGLAGLLTRQGFDVVGQTDRADTLVGVVQELADAGTMPDVVVTDVRMPPTLTHDGLLAALELRRIHPGLAIVVLSQHVSPAYAQQLFALPSDAGTGYLLKDRVSDVAAFTTTLRLIATGGVVIDPAVTRAMMQVRRTGLDQLTPREFEVLELMARGHSNSEIAAELVVTAAAVAKHVARIFTKLGLAAGEENRRVRAILAYLDDARS